MAKNFKVTEKGDGMTEIRWNRGEKGDGNIRWPVEKGDPRVSELSARDLQDQEARLAEEAERENFWKIFPPEEKERIIKEMKSEMAPMEPPAPARGPAPTKMFAPPKKKEEEEDKPEMGGDGQLVSKQERMLQLERNNPDLDVSEKGGHEHWSKVDSHAVEGGDGKLKLAPIPEYELKDVGSLSDAARGKLDEGKGFQGLEGLEEEKNRREEELDKIKLMIEKIRYKQELERRKKIEEIN